MFINLNIIYMYYVEKVYIFFMRNDKKCVIKDIYLRFIEQKN